MAYFVDYELALYLFYPTDLRASSKWIIHLRSMRRGQSDSIVNRTFALHEVDLNLISIIPSGSLSRVTPEQSSEQSNL